jgi:hypothetical protein
MAEAGASDARVLAGTGGAAAFHAACGFRAPEGMARYMTLEGACRSASRASSPRST